MTLDGYQISLSIRNGLAYMDMPKPTDEDIKSLPHVLFMSDMDRDPRYGIVLIEDNLQPEFTRGPVGTYGEIFVCNSDFDSYIDMCLIEVHLLAFLTRNTNVRTNKQDFNSLRPNFCYVNVEHVKHMLENTTQYAHENIRLLLWKYFKSNFQQQTYPLSY